MNTYKRLIIISAITLLVIFIAVKSPILDRRSTAPLQSSDLSNHPIYSKYKFEVNENIINIGVQPLYSPTGVITEALKRDTILRQSLSRLGLEMRFYSFLKGSDVNYFMKNGSLSVGISGDMPTIILASSFDVVIPSLIQMGYTAVIAKQPVLIKELKGKKIGYAYGSNAHYALLAALAQEGLSEKDVTLIPLESLEMPAALKNNKIFAFSAWEPVTTLSTRENTETFAIHKMLTTGYISFRKSLYEKQAEAVYHILAAEVRAIRWLLRSRENRIRAASWVIQSVNNLYTTQPLNLTEELIDELSLKELSNITSAPIIPEKITSEGGPMYNEFIFLKKIGLLPYDTDWNKAYNSFTNVALIKVLDKAEAYRLNEFQYSQQDKANE
ncbi:MAG: ABC transporter substrate-binding protein [Nitrospirae bacterium YQR-1]